MNQTQKREFVSSLKGNLSRANLLVITNQTGMTVDESTDLRAKMRAEGASYKVVKNTLARLAVEDTKFSQIKDQLKGPTAVAYSEDAVAAARVAVKYMKDNAKLSIVSGMLGEKVLDITAIKDLAGLPSLDVLRASILSVILAPATRIATVINGPARSLACVIAARKDD